MAINDLPKESEEQEIGHLAEVTLNARRPLSWRPVSLDGTSDAGLDIQFQITAQGNWNAIFRTQLKGTRSPEKSADGKFYSVTLKGSTVRYWDRVSEPILLVLCDLSVSEEPNECPAYYVWIHDEIDRRRAETPGTIENNEYITFRVPVENELTRRFDAIPELDRHRNLARTGAMMASAVEQIHPAMSPEDVGTLVTNAARGVVSRGATLLDVVSSPASSYWPEAPENSIPGRLNRIAELLRHGSLSDAMKALDTLEVEIAAGAELEQAEFYYLRSQAIDDSEKVDESLRLMRRAWDISQQPKHLAAYAELSMHAARDQPDETEEYERLVGILNHPDEAVLAIKSRLLFILGRKEEAISIVGELPDRSRWTNDAIFALMEDRFDDAVAVCDQALDRTEPGQRGRSLYFMFRARAWFYKAVRFETQGTDRFPYTGPPNLDVQALSRSWDDCSEAAELFSRSGWPKNVEYLADIWVTSALMLGVGPSALPRLKEAADARPFLAGLQAAVEALAVHCGDFDVALSANLRLRNDSEAAIRRPTHYFHLRKFKQCLAQLDEVLDALDHSGESGMALISGVIAAEQLVDGIRAKQYLERLDGFPNPKLQHAWLASVRRSVTQGGADPLAQLREVFDGSTGTAGIGLQLIMLLAGEDRDQAAEILHLTERVQQLMLLPSTVELHVAQALVTLERWDDLLQLGEQGYLRFPQQERYLAIQAFALDKLGRAADARRKLEAMVNEGTRDGVALQIYVNIVARTGFIPEAIGICEQALANADDPKRRMGYLRLLSQLVGIQDPNSPRNEDIAWQIGAITNQEDENEEGGFLALYMMVGLVGAPEVRPERAKEFRQRAEAYQARFPRSKIIQQFDAVEELNVNGLEGLLERIDPGSKQRRENQARLERLLEGGSPCPFVWRPRRILQNVPDSPSLWHLAKGASRKSLQLIMDVEPWEPADRQKIGARIPVMDLTSLLVLNDLGLIDTLFKVFPQVVIGQEIYQSLTEMTSPISFGWGRKYASEILLALRPHFDQIISPPRAAMQDDESLEDRQVASDLARLAREDRFFLYSDDWVYRKYCAISDKPSISTLDMLTLAESEGYISTRALAEAVAKLCQWNVGVVVPYRAMIAALPDNLPKIRPVAAAVDALKQDLVSGPILGGIWHLDRPYQKLHTNAVRLAANWIDDVDNNIDSVTALIAAWYLRAQFHKELNGFSPVQQLAWLTLHVSTQLRRRDAVTARRLWSVFRDVLPTVIGPRMEEKDEREAIELLGRLVAGYGTSDKPEVSLGLLQFLNQGLEQGASDALHFNKGFADESVKRAPKPSGSGG